MSANCFAPNLAGLQGELILLSYTVAPKQLEDLLEALAYVSFPINPQLFHKPLAVTVEFPAFASGIEEVQAVLSQFGFVSQNLKVSQPI